jgi:hypothetical protein
MSSELWRAIVYSLGTVAIGTVVVLGGVAVLGGELPALLAGSAAAVVVQLAIYWSLFFWAFRNRQGLAYSVGVLVRFVAVAVMALVGVDFIRLTPAPALLSMVTCLFGSTLLEALILQRRGMAGVGPGVATTR